MRKKICLPIIIFLIFVSVILTVCACTNQKSVKVSLFDGDEFLREETVTLGNEYSFNALEKDGYTFLGWYSEVEGGTAYTDSSGSSAGITWKENNSTSVYAHWSANTYKIKFEYCGATSQNEVDEISVVYGEEITDRFPIPLRTGYSFQGWYTAETDGNQIVDSIGNFSESANVYNFSVFPKGENGSTLYAHWGIKTVMFNFVTDGSAVESVSYPIGTVLNSLPVSTKDNFCFEAWCLDQTHLSPISFPFTIPEHFDSSVALYAKFTEGTNNILQFETISSTSDREYEVSYSGNDEKIVIPDSYYGKPVTRLKSVQSSTLKTALLPQSIKQISSGAFQNCNALEKVNIPLSVQSLPERIFSGCEKLSSIIIPNAVTTIGKEAFSGCSLIEEIDIPDNVNSIGDGAFRNMSRLKEFTVGAGNERYSALNGVLYYKVGNSSYIIQYPANKDGKTYEIDSSTTRISEYAFSSSKLQSITLGGKISSIENGAFENCRNLVSVKLNSNSTSISFEDSVFANCLNLKAMIIEISKVPTLGDNVFDGVAQTFSIYVPSGVIRNFQIANKWKDFSQSIYSLGNIFGDYAVEEVEGGYAIRQYFGTDAEVVVPEILNAHKIVKISANAFSFSPIEKITLTQYIEEIGDRAFYNCSSLSSIILEGLPPILGDNVFEGINADYGIYIKNTPDVLEQYRSADKWKEISDHIWTADKF